MHEHAHTMNMDGQTDVSHDEWVECRVWRMFEHFIKFLHENIENARHHVLKSVLILLFHRFHNHPINFNKFESHSIC